MPHYRALDGRINWEMYQFGNNHRTWHASEGRSLVTLCGKQMVRSATSKPMMCSICPTCMSKAGFSRVGPGMLRYLRMVRGWYIYALARAVGMDTSYLSRIEMGTRSPSREYVLAMCRELRLEEEESAELLIAMGYAPRALRHKAWTHALQEVSELQGQYSPNQVRTIEDQILKIINFYRNNPEAIPDEYSPALGASNPGPDGEPGTQRETEAGAAVQAAPDQCQSSGETGRLLCPEAAPQAPWVWSRPGTRGLQGRIEALW